jgi:histidinol-phosphate aminotransferase
MNTIEEKVSKLVRPEIQALKAYRVPDASGLIKLDAMESPYRWEPSLTQAWLEALRAVEINRYPDPGARALRGRLRAALKVPAGMDILLGNGSDELLQIVLLALARPGATALAPTPTFVMYEMIAAFAGVKFVGVPLREDNFALDPAAMRRAIAKHKPAVVFLAYPNNPTGNLFDPAEVESLVRESEGLVVLDEAYHAFCRESFLDRLDRYDNLLCLRTFSKQGLAGLRLGVLVGAPAWLHEFDKVRLPYNIGSLTQASALFALEHEDVLEEQAARIRRDRETLHRSLAALPGIRVWPSSANFLLFRVEGRAAAEVYEHLRHRHVLVKNLDAAGGPLTGCLRVTVGTPHENEAFLGALEKSL